ncbi:MAG: response regulator [Chloroflexota bacterium]
MQKTILVAEDSPSIRKFITLALKIQGYNVIPTQDGMDALEKLSKFGADLVVTDLNMPNIDGIRLVKAIRENKFFRRLPIIILSSASREEDIASGIEAGADAYLLKPFNTNKIQSEVAKLLGEIGSVMSN